MLTIGAMRVFRLESCSVVSRFDDERERAAKAAQDEVDGVRTALAARQAEVRQLRAAIAEQTRLSNELEEIHAEEKAEEKATPWALGRLFFKH